MNGITFSRANIGGQLPLAFTEIPSLPTRTVLITPEDAQQILERYKYHGQRPLRPLDVAKYARIMKKGKWETRTIRICVLGDKKYLTDGQHRLSAVVMSGISCVFDLKEIICKDEYEVSKDYTINDAGIVKTDADKLRASGIRERLGISKNNLDSYVAAMRIINTEFSPAASKYLNSKDMDDIEQGMIENEKLFALYTDAALGAHRDLARILKWSGVVAVGVVTFGLNKEKANTFWRALSSGETAFPAIVELERQLLPYSHGGKPPMVRVARIVAFAWKRFNEKPFVKPKMRNVQGVDEPIFIYGSEKYTGHQQSDTVQLNADAWKVY